MSVGNSHIGTYTGTGLALVLNLGFVPAHIRVINLTDGTAGAEWFAAVPGITVGLGAALSKVSSNGISAFTGTPSAPAGINIGTTLSTTGKVFGYIASRAT